jgi:GTPase SAR1 family protein
LEIKEIYDKYIVPSKTIQIFGGAGSGKSTLVSALVKSLNSEPNEKTLWIDSEKKFSANRFKNILPLNNDNNLASDFVLISRPKNLLQQQYHIEMLTKNPLIISSKLKVKCIVLDTASNYFRVNSVNENWVQFSDNYHSFYENHILPLMMLQKKIGCYLILVHQVTNHPKNGVIPYLFRLFKEIPSTWIKLNKINDCHQMSIKGKSIRYQITTAGIQIK